MPKTRHTISADPVKPLLESFPVIEFLVEEPLAGSFVEQVTALLVIDRQIWRLKPIENVFACFVGSNVV